MADEPFLVVVNPRAAAGSAAERVPALRRALDAAGARFDVAVTAGPRDATRIVREALRSGIAGVAVVGGDGTSSEAVNGFFETDGRPIAPRAWLGTLPCGTGGDFRRTLGISKRIDGMVTRLLWSRPRPIDVGWMQFVADDGQRGERAFLNIASFGLSGAVVRRVNDSPKWMGGTPTFLLGTLRAMRHYENQHVRITVDDAPAFEGPVLSVAVANGRYFGGGMKIAPHAEIDDGSFDVVRLELRASESLLLTADVYRGTHIGKRGIVLQRGARKVVAEPIDPAEHVLLDVDGESPGRLPATFEIRPGALLLRG